MCALLLTAFGGALVAPALATAATALTVTPQDVQLGDVQVREVRYVGLTGLNSGTTDVMLGQDLPLGPDYPAVPCRVGDLDTYELHPGEGCAIGIVVAYRRESYGRTLLPSARRNEVGRTRDTELRADRATGHPDHCASVAGTG